MTTQTWRHAVKIGGVRQLLWLALVAGCSFDHGTAPGAIIGGDGSVTDGDGSSDVDAEMITADAQTCWSVSGVNVNVCLMSPLTGMTTVDAAVGPIDTDSSGTGELQCKPLLPGSTDVCVIAAQSLTIASGRTLSAHGDRPLVLLASSLVIDGTVDVSSTLGGRRGPASDSASCAGPGSPAGAGGGAGGSFGGAGGDGGDDDDGAQGGNAVAATTNIGTLRGGCPGDGGGANGPYGGHSGGAVLLLADTLTISGTINASGSAGNGATQGRRGGDGGSSGGMIAISAVALTVDSNAEIFANGGHGGGGSSGGAPGQDGTDPTSPASGGGGGNAGGNGGDGGAGYPSPMRNGRNGTGGGDGGGGGGGGAGVIRIYAPSVPVGPNISPPASS